MTEAWCVSLWWFVEALGLGSAQSDESRYQRVGGLYFIYLPQSKKLQASPKAKYMNIEDSAEPTASVALTIRPFSSGFPQSRQAGGIKWLAAGVRTVDLYLRCCAVICWAGASALAHRRRPPPPLPPHSDDYIHRGTMMSTVRRKNNSGRPAVRDGEHRGEVQRNYLFFCHLQRFIFIPLRTCFARRYLVWLLRKGSVSTLQRWVGGKWVIRKTASSTKWLS